MAKSKRKTISEVEKFYIEANPEGLADQELADKVKCCVTLVKELRANISTTPSVEVIATELSRDVILEEVTAKIKDVVRTEIDKVVNEKQEKKEEKISESTTEVFQGPKAGEYFGHDKSGIRGYTIMTPVASEIADAHREHMVENKTSTSKYDMRGKGKTEVIHRIKG